MTVSELIKALEKFKDEGKGGYEMVVQHRNSGVDYCGVQGLGVDNDIWCDVDETKKRIIL